jgi:hypothetical protein
MHIDFSDEQLKKADSSIRRNVEPVLKRTVNRCLQGEKQKMPVIAKLRPTIKSRVTPKYRRKVGPFEATRNPPRTK